jgi:hypothetical protein
LLKNPTSRALVLAGACLLAICPFFWKGSPSGHDFEFHVFSWMEVLGQWQHGIVYPRWAAGSYWGYGEARFLFYPPASWTVGAALGAVLPWKMVPGAYCWLVLTLAGASMYRLARQWLPPSDALFAAVFYALNPYHLLIVYWRSAYAEMMAAILLPLLLLCLLRLSQPGITPVLWLSLTLTAAWLTNIPAAVMIHYSAVGLAIFLAVTQQPDSRHSLRFLARTALAVLLGVGLASFYLVPAIYEQRWIDIGQVMSPGVRPRDNFLFTFLADLDHNRFNLLLSIMALAEIGVLSFAILFSRQKKRAPWKLLSLWGAAAVFFMFSVSNFLWQYLPKFRFVQLPFRWLLCMNAALALLVTMAAKRWHSRVLTYALLVVVLIVAGRRIQPPWWDTAADLRELSNSVGDGTGYEGTDEYVPAGADASELNKNLPRISDEVGKAIPGEMLQWSQNEKRFTVRTNSPRDLTIRLFNYPAWQVLVNGKPAQTHSTEVTGLMVIPVGAGENDVRIYFGRTKDRLIGSIISLISLTLIIAVWLGAGLLQTRRSEMCTVTLESPAA